MIFGRLLCWRWGWCLGLCLWAVACLGGDEKPVADAADFVLLDGKVHTLDARNRVVQAIAIRGEKIVFAGTDADAKKFIGPRTEVYRAVGRTVIPGINETHVHPIEVAKEEPLLPFRQLGSIAEIQEWVRQRAEMQVQNDLRKCPRTSTKLFAWRVFGPSLQRHTMPTAALSWSGLENAVAGWHEGRWLIRHITGRKAT